MGMPGIRTFAFVGTLALGGAIGGVVSGAAQSGASLSNGGVATETPACQPATNRHVTCLAQVVPKRGHRLGLSSATNASTSSPTGLTPGVISTAYAFPASGGAGETIAIVDAYNDPTATSDLASFTSEYGLPPCTTSDGCLTKVNQTGGTTYPGAATPGWGLETSLDIEWAHGLAPDAHILLVEASSNSTTEMFVAVRYAAQHAQYVTMSWGSTEFVGETAYDASFTAAPNVSFFAASGDSASAVLYPSASPDVVSVGGTVLTVTQSSSAWEAESGWSTAGGGCSLYETAGGAQKAYPTYDQSGATCNGFRATPDIAFDASPSSGVAVYDTIKMSTGGAGWFTVAGTSVSNVIAAARSAVAGIQVDATYLYGSNVRLYNVSTGSNGHPCEVGYNLCTGLGSWNTSVGVVKNGSGGTLSFTPATETLTAGAVSSAVEIHLSAPAPAGGLTVSVSASSGGVASSAAGPFTASTTVTVAGGENSSPSFYLEDTDAGTAVFSASVSGWSSATQTDTVSPARLARIVVSPGTASVEAGTTHTFNATGYDAFGNTISISPTWSAPSSMGSLATTTGPTTTFTAGTTTATFTLSATSGPVTGTASVSVAGLNSMKVSVTDSTRTKSGRSYKLPLTVMATGAVGPIGGASVTLRVYYGRCGGTLVSTSTGATGSLGSWSSTFTTTEKGTFCILATVTASGYHKGNATLSITIAASSK